MDTRFKPKAGRFGVQPLVLVGKQLDAGITASATVVIPIATPYRKLYIARFSFAGQTLAIGGSAITATLNKKPVGSAAVPLTAATSIKVDVQTANVVGLIALLSTLTDGNRIISEGDNLYVDAIAAGTVTTQPVGSVFMVECFVLE